MVWSPDGTVQELSVPAAYGPSTGALSVRDGWVLGEYGNRPDPAATPGSCGGTSPSGLAEPLGDQWRAVAAINRHGWHAGQVEVGSDRWAAVGYGGEPVRLPQPDGLGQGTATYISDDGTVIAGSLATGPGGAGESIMAVRWLCS